MRDQFWSFSSQYQFGLKKPIFSYQLLGDNGGSSSLAQMGGWDPPLREHGEQLLAGLGAPWLLGTRLWLGGTPSPMGRVSGSGLSRAWVVFGPPPLPDTGRVGPGMRIWVWTECLLFCYALTPDQSQPHVYIS